MHPRVNVTYTTRSQRFNALQNLDAQSSQHNHYASLLIPSPALSGARLRARARPQEARPVPSPRRTAGSRPGCGPGHPPEVRHGLLFPQRPFRVAHPPHQPLRLVAKQHRHRRLVRPPPQKRVAASHGRQQERRCGPQHLAGAGARHGCRGRRGTGGSCLGRGEAEGPRGARACEEGGTGGRGGRQAGTNQAEACAGGDEARQGSRTPWHLSLMLF